MTSIFADQFSQEEIDLCNQTMEEMRNVVAGQDESRRIGYIKTLYEGKPRIMMVAMYGELPVEVHPLGFVVTDEEWGSCTHITPAIAATELP